MNSAVVTAAAVIAQAIKASGAIVRVSPEGSLAILRRAKDPLVVRARAAASWAATSST